MAPGDLRAAHSSGLLRRRMEQRQSAQHERRDLAQELDRKSWEAALSAEPEEMDHRALYSVSHTLLLRAELLRSLAAR